MPHGKPKFQVADFVACLYEFLNFYSYLYDEEDDRLAKHYGIIIYVNDEYQEFIDEYIYEVLCLDGIKRYFMESEMKLAAFT